MIDLALETALLIRSALFEGYQDAEAPFNFDVSAQVCRYCFVLFDRAIGPADFCAKVLKTLRN